MQCYCTTEQTRVVKGGFIMDELAVTVKAQPALSGTCDNTTEEFNAVAGGTTPWVQHKCERSRLEWRDLAVKLKLTRRSINDAVDTTPYPAYIIRLSDDLLYEVMLIAADDEEGSWWTRSRKPGHFPQVATMVSRRWQVIALTSPALWSNVTITAEHSPLQTQVCLERSFQAPLSVSWTFGGFEEEWHTYNFVRHAEVLRPSLSRVRRLEVHSDMDIPDQVITEVLFDLAHSSGILRVLQLCGDVESGLAGAFGNPSFVNLSHLEITS